jgi:hypothetical protein
VPWVDLVWSLYGDNIPHAQARKGSFWWREIFSLVEDYRSITHCSIGDGSSILFWKDFWEKGDLLCDRFPRLYSFVINEDISVAAFQNAEDIFSHFILPLSNEAFHELQLVFELLLQNPIEANSTDHRIFSWGNSAYAPSKFSNFMFAQIPGDDTLSAIWKSRMLPKLKVFSWLLILDRLNTRDLMTRKNWHLDSGSNCVLCNAATLETREHLFFECEFALRCWESIGIYWDTSVQISRRIKYVKQNFDGPCFMEILACASWNIWKERNELIFQGQPASFVRWKVRFQKDLLLHQYKVKAALVQPLIDWLRNIFVS